MTDPGRSRKLRMTLSAPFTGSASFRGRAPLGCWSSSLTPLPLLLAGGAGVRALLERDLVARLAVALDRDQPVGQVGDLLLVHGAVVADAPRRHRRPRPALVDGVPGDVGDALARVPLVDLGEVRRGEVGRVRVRLAGRLEALDHAAGRVGPVAPRAELAEGLLAAVARLGEHALGGARLLGWLLQVQHREQDREEDREHGAPELVALQRPALQRL